MQPKEVGGRGGGVHMDPYKGGDVVKLKSMGNSHFFILLRIATLVV